MALDPHGKGFVEALAESAEKGTFCFSAANGFATVTVSGFVKDPIADNVPRGSVSMGRADGEARLRCGARAGRGGRRGASSS
jgi:hypothetical protein